MENSTKIADHLYFSRSQQFFVSSVCHNKGTLSALHPGLLLVITLSGNTNLKYYLVIQPDNFVLGTAPFVAYLFSYVNQVSVLLPLHPREGLLFYLQNLPLQPGVKSHYKRSQMHEYIVRALIMYFNLCKNYAHFLMFLCILKLKAGHCTFYLQIFLDRHKGKKSTVCTNGLYKPRLYLVKVQGLNKIMETSMVKEQNLCLIWCWTTFGFQGGLNSPGN